MLVRAEGEAPPAAPKAEGKAAPKKQEIGPKRGSYVRRHRG